jgi:hypothetical protein
MRRRFVRRHASWLIPLSLAVCAWIGTIRVGRYSEAHSGGQDTKDVLVGLVGLVALVLTLVGVVLAVRNGWRTRHILREQRRDEVIRRQHEEVYANGWQQGRVLAHALVSGKRLEPLTVWGLVLRPSETAYLDVTVDVAEIGTYPTGEPAWLSPQTAQLIATNQRLVINTDRWMSIWYRDIVGFYPDLDRWRVSMDIVGASPASMTGPRAPVIAVYLTALLYGRERLPRHPHIAKLLSR